MLKYQLEEELEELVLEEELEDLLEGDVSNLVVYNDNVNTFEWVIDSFMEILGHSFTQSEQLATLIHFKGKATVKTAPLSELKAPKDALVDRGLSAVIS